MLSLEVLHVEIAQKLQILEILLIFSHFLMDFQFSSIFWVIFENIFQKPQKNWQKSKTLLKMSENFQIFNF